MITNQPTAGQSQPSATVWATRPSQQNLGWSRHLESAGWVTVARPLLSIQKLSDPAGCRAIKNIVLELDKYDILIFVSQNAVKLGFEAIGNYWPELPIKQHYLAVGKKTAQALLSYVAHVAAPGEAMDSDAVLALPLCQNVTGKRIVIFRGRGGLPRMGQILVQRGAAVDYCELYDRVYPNLEPGQANDWSARLAANTWVIPVFSGDTLKNLKQFLAQVTRFSSSAFDEQKVYRNGIIVVPGERVAQLAKTAGFSRVLTAKNASQEEMLKAVNTLREKNANFISTQHRKGELHD